MAWQFIKGFARGKRAKRFGTREELLDWQDHRAKQIIYLAQQKSKFYRSHFKGLSINHWRQYPVVDKLTMMSNFDAFNTIGVSKTAALACAKTAEESRDFSPLLPGNISVGLSSGTSGNQGLFLATKAEREFWAGYMVAKAIPFTLQKRHKVALILRANNKLYETLKGLLVEFRFFDLLDPMEKVAKALENYGPSILCGPPSALTELSKHLTGQLPVQHLYSAAEVLDEQDAKKLEASYGCQPKQIYQCTEGFLGVSCAAGKLHLNEDLVVVEKEYFEGSKTRFNPVVTDLFRVTQPIIRYRLNDVLVASKEPCECGSVFQVIDKIEGRCDDVFHGQSADSSKIVTIFPDFIRRTIAAASPDIEDYRCIQVGPSKLNLQLKTRHAGEEQERLHKKATQALEQLYKRQNLIAPQIQKVPYMPRSKGEKQRRVYREF